MSVTSLFTQIEQEMPGYLSAAVGSLDAGGAFSSHSAGDLDLGEQPDALRAMLRDYSTLYEGLGGRIDLGSNDEVLISATRSYILAKLDHRANRFVAVLLSSNGNIGYLRFRMRQYLSAAAEL